MKKTKIYNYDNKKFLFCIDIESFKSYYTATPYKKINYEIIKLNDDIKGYETIYKCIDHTNYMDYTFKELFEIIKNEIIEKIEKDFKRR